MNIFIKTVIAVLITTLLCIVIGKQQKDLSLLLSLAAVCLICSAAFTFLKPVIELMQKLSKVGELSGSLFEILLKTVGIALLSEVTELVCDDAGNKSLGKSLHILSVVVILWLSIPLFDEIIDLLQSILVRK